MLKKKNIAMMTAALTVATTVTPAFAAVTTVKDMADATQKQAVLDQVKGYLNTTYTTDKTKLVDEDNAGKSAYKVELTGNIDGYNYTTTSAVASTYAEFENLLNKINSTDGDVTIKVTDLGHRTVDGQIVDWDEYTFENVRNETASSSTLAVFAEARLNAAMTDNTIKVENNIVRAADINAVASGATTTGATAEIKIDEAGSFDIDGNGTTGSTIVTYKGSDVSKDFSKPVRDAEGYIVNFENAREAINVMETSTLATPVMNVTVKNSGSQTATTEKVTVDAAELMEEGRLTVKGNELKSNIADLNNEVLRNAYGKAIKLQAAKDTVTGAVLQAKEVVAADAVSGEDMYTVATGAVTYVDATTSELKITVTPELGYAYKSGAKMTATGATVTAGTVLTTGNTVIDKTPVKEITVKGTHSQVREYAQALAGTMKVKTLAGTDRYKTAVEVSKKAFTTTANTAVLVSGEALVDGLTATPYAAQQNAPILLTESGKLNADTKAELERLNVKNVHIVGGTTAVSSTVVDELGAMGINVERIAGNDRYETSLAVAKKMGAVDTVYVAQGDAMADALSVSAVAGQSLKPIVLTGKDSISKDITTFITDKDVKNAYVIGGSGVVSNTVVKELDKVATNVKVLGGADRYETNAAVINEFANGANEVIVVNGDKGLVDALAAGAYAGNEKTKSQALVLAGNDLSVNQKLELTQHANSASTKVQVGYGIAAKVINTLNGIFK